MSTRNKARDHTSEITLPSSVLQSIDNAVDKAVERAERKASRGKEPQGEADLSIGANFFLLRPEHFEAARKHATQRFKSKYGYRLVELQVISRGRLNPAMITVQYT
jgi:hypothetical protein